MEIIQGNPILQVDENGCVMISEKQVDDIVARVVAASSDTLLDDIVARVAGSDTLLDELVEALTERPDRFQEVWDKVGEGKQPLFKELLSDKSRNYKVYLYNPTSDEVLCTLTAIRNIKGTTNKDDADYVLFTVTSSTTFDEIQTVTGLHGDKLVVYCPIPLSYWYLVGELSNADTRLLTTKEELVAFFD